MLPPLPRCSSWASSSLILTQPYQPSPKGASGRPAHRPFRGVPSFPSRCGLHTRAVTKSCPDTQRLQTFRLLHACSGCFRRERFRRVGLAPTGKRRLSRRTPTAAILDSRTLQSTPESGHRAGYDGAKRRKGSKLHLAVDTLGHLLAAHVTPADEQDRGQVERLAAAVQAATGE